MKVLGISHDVFICSACLIDDGRIVAAMPEERLDRVKQSRVFPTRAIDACLRAGGITLQDVDEIAIAWNPAIEAETTPSGYLSSRRWRSEHLMQVPSRLLQLSNEPAAPVTHHTELWDGAPPVSYVDHYLAHVFAQGVPVQRTPLLGESLAAAEAHVGGDVAVVGGDQVHGLPLEPLRGVHRAEHEVVLVEMRRSREVGARGRRIERQLGGKVLHASRLAGGGH